MKPQPELILRCWHNRCHIKDMKHPQLKAFLLTCLVLACAVTVSARTTTFEITRGAKKYTGEVSYDVEKAYAGAHTLEVNMSVKTQDTVNLELDKFEVPDQTQISFKESSTTPSFDTATGMSTNEYKYLVDIPANTDPRIYVITVKFKYPGDKNISRTFDLYVGVRNKGKLNVVPDTASTAEFLTGVTNPYRLELENNFPDFPVNVRSVSIKSEPAGLIENTTVEVPNLTITPLQRGAIDLNLKVASMGFTNLLSGFSESTKMIVQVSYDDSYGHLITDYTYPIKVKVRPRDRVLVIAMLFGVLIGAIIKLYLQRLQQQGIITRREVLVAVAVTSFIGLVVSFVAVVGRIKIIAFDQMGSYDNPAVIFVVGLAGAVGGAQLLSTFFKSGTSMSVPAVSSPQSAAAAKPAS